MANKDTTEAAPKVGFTIFKKRPRSADKRTQERIAQEADPFGHVGTTKSSGRRIREKIDFNETGPEDEAAPKEIVRLLNPEDAFADAYKFLNSHGGVYFGAERADGSWEVHPPLRLMTQEEVNQQAAEQTAEQAAKEATPIVRGSSFGRAAQQRKIQ